MHSHQTALTKSLEELVMSATSQDAKVAIVVNWLRQFPAVLAKLNENDGYFECNTQGFAELILEQYLSPERNELVTHLLTDRTDEEVRPLLRLLTNFQTYQLIATEDLSVLIAVCNTCKFWQLDRILYILEGVYKNGKGDLGLIKWSKTHTDFFKLFLLDNIVALSGLRKFDSEMIRRFFKVLRMSEESLLHLYSLSTTMDKIYFNAFFFNLLQKHTTPFIRELCEDKECLEILHLMPYMMLVDDEDYLTDPVTREFADRLFQHNMASKRYSISQYTTGLFSRHDLGKNFADYRWTPAVLAAMMGRVKKGKDLLSAVIELIIASEGRALPKMGLCFPSAENPDLTLLETMVFDYPEYLTEFYDFSIDRNYMENQFVKFEGYSDPQAAKETLKHLRIARLFLLNAGRNPVTTFNMLQPSGVFSELTECDQTSENLRMLTIVPHGDSRYICPFFEAHTLLHAHQTDYADGKTLLQTLLSTDVTRFKLLIRAMCLYISQYTSEATDEENVHLSYIQLCNDFLNSGLMECILNLNPPELLTGLKHLEIELDRGLEIIMEELKEPISRYSNELQVIALNMMLRAINVATPYLTNMDHNQDALPHFIAFLASQFQEFVTTIGEDNHDTGKFKQSIEDRALSFLRNSKNAQAKFENQIWSALEELGLDRVAVSKHLM